MVLEEPRTKPTTTQAPPCSSVAQDGPHHDILAATSLPILSATANDVSVTVLVDTGAARTLVSTALVKNNDWPCVEGPPIHLRFADGAPYSSTSYCQLHLVINELQSSLLLPVAPLANYDILLGTDFLAQHQVSIDWKSNSIVANSGQRLSVTRREPHVPPLQQINARKLEQLLRNPEHDDVFAVFIGEMKEQEGTATTSEFSKAIMEEYSDLFPEDLPSRLPPPQRGP